MRILSVFLRALSNPPISLIAFLISPSDLCPEGSHYHAHRGLIPFAIPVLMEMRPSNRLPHPPYFQVFFKVTLWIRRISSEFTVLLKVDYPAFSKRLRAHGMSRSSTAWARLPINPAPQHRAAVLTTSAKKFFGCFL